MKNWHIKITAIGISMLAVGIFLFTAPSFVRRTVLSENRVAYEQPIPSVAHGYILSQQFIPQYDRIESIEVYINTLDCDVTHGELRVSISDEELTCIYENTILLTELPEYGMTGIVGEVQLQSDHVYNLMIEAVGTVDDGPVISFYPTVVAAGKEESGLVLSYAGLPLEDSVLRASFRYSVPLAAADYIVYCFFLLFIVCFLAEKILGTKV